MDEFIKKFNQDLQLEIDEAEERLDRMKRDFRTTRWSYVKEMVECVNRIWALEERIKDVKEMGKWTLENYRAVE